MMMREWIWIISIVVSIISIKGDNFFENFESFDTSSWITSDDSRYNGQRWSAKDNAIAVDVPHKFYGLSRVLDDPVELGTNGDFVMQYEVAFPKGITCSGSYVKLLEQSDSFNGKNLVEASPYSIMFGPDVCGATRKVHLIFRQENPVTGKYEEKHLKPLINPPTDAHSHLYTLIVRPDNTFEVRVDNQIEQTGSLLDHDMFVPPFQQPKEIDDPEDKKPKDWVDQDTIPDMSVEKPDDWDNLAPKKIVDPDAIKPSGWEDNEPFEVSDPDATQPSDWNEEDDGEWEAPLIKNPKCAVGCGEWKPPMIDNPDYKGIWSRPMIPNPDYKGEWKPRKIPNPGYFEEKNPVSTIKPVGAIAIEILANDVGIQFDSIMIGHDADAASAFANDDFGPRRAEDVKQIKEEHYENNKKIRLHEYEHGGFIGMVNYYIGEVLDFIAKHTDYDPKLVLAGIACAFASIYLFLHKSPSNEETPAPTEDAAAHKKDDDKDAPADDDAKDTKTEVESKKGESEVKKSSKESDKDK